MSEYYHHGYIAIPTNDGADVHYILPRSTTKDIITKDGKTLDAVLTELENSEVAISTLTTAEIDAMWEGTYKP